MFSAAASNALSGGTKGSVRALAILSVGLLVFVVLVHAMQWRDTRFAEGFEVIPAISMASARHPKSSRYLRAGLRFFFSDGAASDDSVMFFPSSNDIICQLGNQQVSGAACSSSKTRIHMLSRRDPTTVLNTSFMCTSSGAAAAVEPLDLQDCRLRIMTGMYDFVKSCVATPLRISADMRSITLKPNSYGARVLMLSRPQFINGPLSKLYAVQYETALAGGLVAQNHICDYDSARSSGVLVPISPVMDSAIWDQADGVALNESVNMLKRTDFSSQVRQQQQQQQQRVPAGTDVPIVLPITQFYVNYVRTLPPPPTTTPSSAAMTSAPAQYNMLTLYFPIDDKEQSGMKFSIDRLGFRVSASAAPLGASGAVAGPMYRVETRGGRPDQTIPALPNGLVVVTYTTNMLIMVSFNRMRTCLRCFPRQANLAVTQEEVDKARSAAPPPDAAAFPYDNVCVPNFADLAIKLGMLGSS